MKIYNSKQTAMIMAMIKYLEEGGYKVSFDESIGRLIAAKGFDEIKFDYYY